MPDKHYAIGFLRHICYVVPILILYYTQYKIMRNVQETEIIRISLENQNIAHILLFEAFKST